MDHMRILKRAFAIVREYRTLWIFGFLLALTTARPSSNPGGGNGSGGSSQGGNGGMFPPFHLPSWSPEFINGMIGLGIALLCLGVFLVLLFVVLRYISETAAIRMVTDYETTGQKVGFREGFRLGWNRKAFRLFLIDLVIGLVGFLAFILLAVLAAAPLLTLLSDNNALRVFGGVASAGLFLLVIFLAILASIVLSLLLPFFRRAAVIEGFGVTDAINRGYRLVRTRLGDVVLMGLIVFGLNLGFTILLIPVFILLGLAAVILGGLPGALVWWIASQLTASETLPWVFAAVIGVPVFLVVLALPSLFLSGLFEAFKSANWTLTYRELLALEGPREFAPALVEPQPEEGPGETPAPGAEPELEP